VKQILLQKQSKTPTRRWVGAHEKELPVTGQFFLANKNNSWYTGGKKTKCLPVKGNDMIKYYYKSLRSTQVQELKEYKRGSWVYVETPTADELAFLIDKFDVDAGHLDRLALARRDRLRRGELSLVVDEVRAEGRHPVGQVEALVGEDVAAHQQ